MAYTTDLPPTIAHVDSDVWELRDATGNVIATYNQTTFESPTDWWSDIVQYILSETSGRTRMEDAVTDISLLIIREDWEFVDER